MERLAGDMLISEFYRRFFLPRPTENWSHAHISIAVSRSLSPQGG